MTDHPFQPGVKVAVPVIGGMRVPTSYREAVVDKVYKTGRFVLVGDESKQQWRAWPPTEGGIGAHSWERHLWTATGRGSSWEKLLLVEPATEARIAEANEAKRSHDRFARVSNTLYRLSHDCMTPEALDLFEAAIAAMKPGAKR